MNRLRTLFRPVLAVAAAAILLAGCATGPTIRTDADPAANFGRYHTWAFYQPLAMEKVGYTTWVSDRIKADIRREMDARGYVYSERSPDLRVNFRERTERRQQVYSVPQMDIGYAYSHRARAFIAIPIYYDSWQVANYEMGVLSLDVVDAPQNHLVWTGDAIGRVMYRLPEKRAAEIDTTIGALFAHYPYQAGNAQPIVPAKK